MTQKPPPGAEITALLAAWGEGDRQALDALLPLVHEQLKRLARRHMARERSSLFFKPCSGGLAGARMKELLGLNQMTLDPCP